MINRYKNKGLKNLQAQKVKKGPEGVYLHVPFCGSTCDFCAFYQEKPHRKDLDRYIQGVKDEIDLVLPKQRVKTMFWGGGTPGLLTARDIEEVGRYLVDHLGGVPEEWTIEMAPATVKADKIRVMKEIGVSRISMGVQSFDEKLLKSLGRLHSPKQVYRALEIMREEGFENFNLDLIFAIPGQDQAAWERDLREGIACGPKHISTYCLTFEEDTAMYVRLSQGKVSIDIENEAQMYERTWGILEEAGYEQYEVSNFAKPGYECRHNIDTWEMREWVGLGPSGSSQYGGRRWTNVSNLGEWLDGVNSKKLKVYDEVELSDDMLAMDSVIFGIRMNRGIDIGILMERFPSAGWERFKGFEEKLLSEGYAERKGSILKLSNEGRILADKIGEEVFMIFS